MKNLIYIFALVPAVIWAAGICRQYGSMEAGADADAVQDTVISACPAEPPDSATCMTVSEKDGFILEDMEIIRENS